MPHKANNWFTQDVGGWFLFFFVLYIILVIKLTTNYTLHHNYILAAYSILVSLYILSRFLLAHFHEKKKYDPGYEPTVSFVVPAKNEEDNIFETIRRFTLVDYPKDKMEVITINDGSTDGTLTEMHRAGKACEDVGINARVIHWEVNRGKRDGMAEGVRLARNDIVIFVDSDSFIDKDCVRHLIKYFSEPQVGAASGHTFVYNRDDNLLTRMQALRYYVAFKIYKAAESIFGSVTCCPGCCSAYRREYLVPIIDAWLNQKFLGSKCTFGDDRSLTNFIIKQYDAVYCTDAMAYTVVPNTFQKYLKQQQRWKKSWVRETFIAASFMWRKNAVAAVSFYVYMFLAFAAPIVFMRAMIVYPIFVTHTFPVRYAVGLVIMLLLHGIYYRNQTRRSSWFLPVIVFWLYTVLLMWQLPWAFVTITDSRWGTR